MQLLATFVFLGFAKILRANSDRGGCVNCRPPTQQGHVNWQNAQTMKKAKPDDSKEHSEEDSEYLGCSESKHDHSKEGTETWPEAKKKKFGPYQS